MAITKDTAELIRVAVMMLVQELLHLLRDRVKGPLVLGASYTAEYDEFDYEEDEFDDDPYLYVEDDEEEDYTY